ncbi:MAG: hypothetical protein LBG11_04705 [Bifidobacteriaceae bacterium]|jgi:hypothetical protein|nr:hypothetical protein [Bifidobacteriaceae bacterium]
MSVRNTGDHKPVICAFEPPIGIEPETYSLRLVGFQRLAWDRVSFRKLPLTRPDAVS